MKKAMFWTAQANGAVTCNLCHHRCLIQADRRGICSVRENRDGILYPLVYERPSANAVDLVEKKPLYHFLPGTPTFSIATRGCNFKCLFCQNCRDAQVSPGKPLDQGKRVEPRQIVQAALALGCKSISYTYTEPTVFFEYAYDTARLAAEKNLKNVFVTNGYITPEPLREIAPWLDAANIDLKFFSDELYRTFCGARLQPVLDTIRLYHELGIWIEVTTLIIPSLNDADESLRRMAAFIADLDTGIPWHVTAFHPAYKLTDLPPTPLSTLRRAREIGLETGLQYVYTGNRIDDDGSTTRCPACAAVVIRRPARTARSEPRFRGSCHSCGHKLDGIWI